MNLQLSKTPIGLDGVPAAETVLSHVDGERGELIIAGEIASSAAASRAERYSSSGFFILIYIIKIDQSVERPNFRRVKGARP